MQNNQLAKEENFNKIQSFISNKLNDGFTIVEKNEKYPFVVLSKRGKDVNHNLNFFICCCTLGLWSVVWAYLSYKSYVEKKILVAIDEDGLPFTEKILN